MPAPAKRGYSTDYFENDSTMDEYDSIDCDFLLAVLGDDNSRKSSIPNNTNQSVTSDLSSQLTIVKIERSKQSFEQNSVNNVSIKQEQYQQQFMKAKTILKAPSIAKSASSRSIQLEASKDRRR